MCVRGHPAPVYLHQASEPSSPRKRGPGGVATMDRPHPYQNGCDLPIGANPGDLFAPFGSLQKGLAARRRRNAPNQKVWCKTGGRGQAPALRHYVTQGRRAQWSRPTQTIIVACSPRHPKGVREDAAPYGCPVASRGRWPSHPYDVPHLKLHIPIHLLEIRPHHAHLP